jgi:hypothetical protein
MGVYVSGAKRSLGSVHLKVTAKVTVGDVELNRILREEPGPFIKTIDEVFIHPIGLFPYLLDPAKKFTILREDLNRLIFNDTLISKVFTIFLDNLNIGQCYRHIKGVSMAEAIDFKAVDDE